MSLTNKDESTVTQPSRALPPHIMQPEWYAGISKYLRWELRKKILKTMFMIVPVIGLVLYLLWKY